jgi:DNA-binding transcriptional LysR family regulator
VTRTFQKAAIYADTFKIFEKIRILSMGMLEDISLFVRVVEKGSFSSAGRDLRMSAAVVSHRIMSLEKRLGARLFTRTTRSMQLTTSGQMFHERAIELVEAAARTEASIGDEAGTPKGPIKVTAPLGLGRRLLGPAALRFLENYAGIDIRVRLSEHLVDLTAEGIDVALRLANFSDSSFILKKVAQIDRILCAAPAYLEHSGMPQSIDDLKRHSCLLLRFPGSRQFRWPFEDASGKVVQVAVGGRIDADDGDLLTSWALAGQGIILKPVFEVAEHLSTGALVPVLYDFPPEALTLGVLYPSRQLIPAKIRVFADFLVDEARAYVDAELKKAEGVLPPLRRSRQ